MHKFPSSFQLLSVLKQNCFFVTLLPTTLWTFTSQVIHRVFWRRRYNIQNQRDQPSTTISTKLQSTSTSCALSECVRVWVQMCVSILRTDGMDPTLVSRDLCPLPSPKWPQSACAGVGWIWFDGAHDFQVSCPEEVIEHNDQGWWAQNCTVASASQQWNNLGWDLTSFDCEIMQWFELVMGAILSQLKFFWKHFIRMEFYLCVDREI